MFSLVPGDGEQGVFKEICPPQCPFTPSYAGTSAWRSS